LAVNAWDEEEDVLRRFVTENKLKQRVLIDGGETADRYMLGGSVPTLLWIGRNGVVVDTEWGFGESESLEAKTRLLLSTGG
jgi:hypothetical protein